MTCIAERLIEVRSRISAACVRSGRDMAEVTLLAVSKTFPAEAVREAVAAGQTTFAENRFQELEAKAPLCPAHLAWHFIGGVQRNKVRKILPLAAAVHAVDSLRLAAYIDGVAADLGLFPKVFLQVNHAQENSKGGFEEEELLRNWEALMSLPRLEIQGLMCIPPPEKKAGEARRWFAKLRDLRDRLEKAGDDKLPFLSMGMSGDYEVAVEEGATHVRVGSAIFGGRAYRVDGRPT